MLFDAIDAIPKSLLPAAAKNALAWRLEVELFSELGRPPGTVIFP